MAVNMQHTLEFCLLRYVPNLEAKEFTTIAVLATEQGGRFAEARFVTDWRKVMRADPYADLSLLDALKRDIQKQWRDPDERAQLLNMMNDGWCNSLQISSIESCETEQPTKQVDILASRYLS